MSFSVIVLSSSVEIPGRTSSATFCKIPQTGKLEKLADLAENNAQNDILFLNRKFNICTSFSFRFRFQRHNNLFLWKVALKIFEFFRMVIAILITFSNVLYKIKSFKAIKFQVLFPAKLK